VFEVSASAPGSGCLNRIKQVTEIGLLSKINYENSTFYVKAVQTATGTYQAEIGAGSGAGAETF
jgi:hypothetical protein